MTIYMRPLIGMSKRYVQTKLSFSKSEVKRSPRTHPYVYRKSHSEGSSSGSMAHSDKPSYASMAGGSSMGRGRGSSSHQGSGYSSKSRDFHSGFSSHGSDKRPGSPSLFSDDEPEYVLPHHTTTSKSSAQGAKATSIRDLRRAPACQISPLPQLEPNRKHKVLFRIPVSGLGTELLIPHPNEYKDKWDENYVYMPCSPQNMLPVEYGQPISRWSQIESALNQHITGFFELEEAILSYNQWYAKRWSFSALRDYLTQSISKKQSDDFFSYTLPFIQKLALMLPNLITQPIPMLSQGQPMKITMSQQQAACLLANAFFCTFPKRNARVRSSPLTDINFSNLFSGGRDGNTARKEEKLKCIIHYFERLMAEMPCGTLTYSREVLHRKEMPDWSQCKARLTDLYVSTDGTIEDDGEGMLQADFANKYIGGGVLGHGLVQEEIRFVICPEMILARLFTQVLDDNEVLIMTGCERFSKYKGYSDSFQFDGDYVDTTARDSWGRKYTEVVAMDALAFKVSDTQFEETKILRELNKAYCAFLSRDVKSSLPAVRTGNWGCGAFRGDKHLKALIQMMAASLTNRQICYFTFGDKILCQQLQNVHKMLQKYNITVKEIYNLINDYRTKELKKSKYWTLKSSQTTLFKFVANSFGESLDSLSLDYNNQASNSSHSPYQAEDFASMNSDDDADFVHVDMHTD